MSVSILVAYATKHGSTQEVAEGIAATLRKHALEVEVRPASEVRTLDKYSAIVLGAPLYTGRWHKDAIRFLKRHHTALAERPVAIFALGPRSAAEEERQSSREQLDHALAKASWLTPMAIEIFGGVIDPTKLPFPFNRMPASDARDWEAIRTWAGNLARQFQPVLA